MKNDSVRTDGEGTGPVTNDNPAQVESLTDLAGAAAALDAGTAPGGPSAPEAAVSVVDEASSITDVVEVLEMGKAMLIPAVEMSGFMKPGQVDQIWNKAALERIAKPAVALLARYDMNIMEALDKFMPWVMLIGGIAGPTFATYKAVKENVATLKAGNVSEQQQQPA